MKVKMIHALLGIGSTIDHGPETAFGHAFCFRNSGSDPAQMPQEGFVLISHLGKPRHVQPWNNQNVHGRLWGDIAKRQYLLVFIDDVGG
jgi:hypothetical protein